MIRLSVNVNKVATLRNARGGGRPSVRQAAEVAIAAGCHGITVHPRPDERHIRAADVEELASWLPVELNVEGYPGESWLRLVERVRPAQATLVPDPRTSSRRTPAGGSAKSTASGSGRSSPGCTRPAAG